jgi:hypothetical protein
VRLAGVTTLGQARRTNIGGPYPGLRPAKDAFPDDPSTEAAAWCWLTGDAGDSPQPGGTTWSLYLVVPGGRATRVFTTGLLRPPTRLPVIR